MERNPDGTFNHPTIKEPIIPDKVEVTFEVKSYPKLVLASGRMDGERFGWRNEILAVHGEASYSSNVRLTREELERVKLKTHIEFIKGVVGTMDREKGRYLRQLKDLEKELVHLHQENRGDVRRSIRIALKKNSLVMPQ